MGAHLPRAHCDRFYLERDERGAKTSQPSQQKSAFFLVRTPTTSPKVSRMHQPYPEEKVQREGGDCSEGQLEEKAQNELLPACCEHIAYIGAAASCLLLLL